MIMIMLLIGREAGSARKQEANAQRPTPNVSIQKVWGHAGGFFLLLIVIVLVIRFPISIRLSNRLT